MGCASFGYLVGVIIFYSVRFLLKKNNQIEFKKKTETGSNRPVSVRFDFLDKNRFKPVWLGFFRFGLVFLVWIGFFLFGFGSVFSVSGL
jgi:hypothetical protein